MTPHKPRIVQTTNRPQFAGHAASSFVLFGEYDRYKVQAFHTRFDAIEWHVTDAETLDDLGLPAIIRQAPTFEQAVAGLS
jgi:hypothetical protein